VFSANSISVDNKDLGFFSFKDSTPGAFRVIVDRDNTILRDPGYLHRIEDFEFMDGAIEGLLAFQSAGFEISVFTNQSGISRGFYTVDQMIDLNKVMVEKLFSAKVIIRNLVACYHLKTDACGCRKPKDGMLRKLIENTGLLPYKSVILGDKESDLMAGSSLNIPGFLIKNSEDWKIAYKETRRIFCL
jgi:D-glycero-D-manno-heptose 1,7-bisphosphate phosphatase